MNADVFQKNMDAARTRVEMMDTVDGVRTRDIGTILAALECGLKNPETGAQFDALYMLMDRRQSVDPEIFNQEVEHYSRLPIHAGSVES